MTGYDLAGTVDGSIGYFWNVTRSQIYREIKQLLAAKLISVRPAGVREKRLCSITDAGRAAFKEWIERDPAGELIRFPLLLTLFFGDHVDRPSLEKALDTHRARHAARLEQYRALLPEVRREAPFPALTLQFGVIYEEAVLKWFDTIELPLGDVV